MKTFFAWNTIDGSHFDKEILYMFGSPVEARDFESWNSINEDLEIQVTITPRPTMPGLADYILPGEQAGVLLRWTGDNKFSGCSTIISYDPSVPSVVRCTIEKGYSATHISVECNLIIQSPAGNAPAEWPRPPGSILAVIPVLENKRIGSGSIFPMWEFNGDGKNLIQWEFASNEDLEMPVISAVTVLIDKTHPLISKTEYEINKPLVNLIIIQEFVRKAFNPGIFDQLLQKHQHNDPWPADCIGASFDALLKKIAAFLHVDSYQTLKDIYAERPERIDQAVDTLFSPTLKL